MDPISFCAVLLLGLAIGVALGRAWYGGPSGPTTYHITNDNRQTHHHADAGEFFDDDDEEDDREGERDGVPFGRPWIK
jgi:hypothetical protein